MRDPRSNFLEFTIETPNQLAISDAKSQLTYRQFSNLTEKIAWSLVNKGLEAKYRVAYLGCKSIASTALTFACLSRNIVFIPLDSEAPIERISYQLSKVKPDIVISSAQIANRFSLIKNLCTLESLYENVERQSLHVSLAAFDPDAPAYMMFTSGSSGKPKAVSIPWRALSVFYSDISAYYPVHSGAHCLNTAPIFFDVSILDIWFPLFSGASVRLTDKSELFPPVFLNILEKEKIEFMCCVAPQLKIITTFESLFSKYNLNSLQVIMTGAESPDRDCMRLWIQKNKRLKLLNGYGPTETTCVASVYSINQDNVESPYPYPIGSPLQQTKITLINQDTDSPSTSGEIYISGHQLMSEYFSDLQQTTAHLIDIEGETFYKTGDLGGYNERGEIVFYGRHDQEVKISGYRINLSEISNNLISLPNVKDVFTTTTDNPNTGMKEITVAYLSSDSEEVAVKDILKSKLPGYMIPKNVFKFSVFPRLSSGKSDRQKIKTQLSELLTKNTSTSQKTTKELLA